MSIKVQSHVWESSPAKGSDLLILLAIADFADDAGVAWPGVETLARKARLSKRQAQYCLRSLTDAGLLQIEESAGPHGTHRYRVMGVQALHGADSARVQNPTQRGAKSAPGGVQPVAPEPSIQPSKNRHNSNTPKPARRNGLTEVQQSRFERWYSTYPRKVSKGDAAKAWAKIDPDDELTCQMIDKVQEWSESDAWSDSRYVPYPASWLNAERWEDGPPPPPVSLTVHHGGNSRPKDEGMSKYDLANYARELERRNA